MILSTQGIWLSKNSTSDGEINAISLREERIVITKDSDFWDSFMLRQEPFKLLLITTGNINNRELEMLFSKNLGQLVELFSSCSLVEMSRDSLIVHQ